MFRPIERSLSRAVHNDSSRLPVWLVPYLLTLAVLLISSPGVVAQSPSAERTVEGKAQIVDGDTLEIGNHRVHLYGIDAPEADQTCERKGKPWRCGLEVTFAMSELLEFNWLICRQREIDTAGDIVGVCRIGGPKGFSVNREIVRRGWALALRPSGGDYAAAEQEAQAANAGLWSGSFVAPWEWRRKHDTGKTTN